jgi:hypothetical protein
MEDEKTGARVELAGRSNHGDKSQSVAESNVRSVEAHGILVCFEKSAYPDAEGSSEEDVGVKH